MTTYYKISLHPVFDGYASLNDLEQSLGSFGFPQFKMVSILKIWFERCQKELTQKHGVKFTQVKKSKYDETWSIHLGRKHLGSYMIIYSVHRDKLIKTALEGSKSRVLDNTKTPEDKVIFQDCVIELDRSLSDPQVNSYGFYKHTLDFMRTYADLIEPIRTVWGRETKSSYYYLSLKYKPVIDALVELYPKFNMLITVEEVNL